jgi:hypothetical protein
MDKKEMLDTELKDVKEARADIPFELRPANKIVRPEHHLRDKIVVDGYVYKVTRAYSRNRYSIKLASKEKV